MKRIVEYLLAALGVALALFSCAGGRSGRTEEVCPVSEMLDRMRCDTAWIRQLDSLASLRIGPGARCIDPVKHFFSWDGRTWVYGQDWGGILEIPAGYLVGDDEWQVLVSFHGTSVFSPDSLVVISFYEGFCGLAEDEFVECVKKQFDDQPFVKVTSVREALTDFGEGCVSKTVEMETRTDDGIVGWGRYVRTDPQGIEYSISIQYPEEMEERIGPAKEMVGRYPFSPDGSAPRGECL